VRLQLHETGQAQIDGAWVAAANIAQRDGVLHAQVGVDEEPAVDVAEGDEIEIAGSRWRVVEIVEDPVHHRGDVFIERAQE